MSFSWNFVKNFRRVFFESVLRLISSRILFRGPGILFSFAGLLVVLSPLLARSTEDPVSLALSLWKKGDLKGSRLALDRAELRPLPEPEMEASALKLEGLLELASGDRFRGERLLEDSRKITFDPVIGLRRVLFQAKMVPDPSLLLELDQLLSLPPVNPPEKDLPFFSWHPFYCPDESNPDTAGNEEIYPLLRLNSPARSGFYREEFWRSTLHPLDRASLLFTGIYLAHRFGDKERLASLRKGLQAPLPDSPYLSEGTRKLYQEPEDERVIQGCLIRLEQIYRTLSPEQKRIRQQVEEDSLMLLRYRAVVIPSVRSLFTLGLEAKKQEKHLEALHAFRGALEKSGFYSRKAIEDPQTALQAREILLQLEQIYIRMGKKPDAEMTKDFAGFLLNPGPPENALQEMLRIASRNLHNREGLRFQEEIWKHDERGRGLRMRRLLEERDQKEGLDELQNLYPFYP